MRLPWSSPTRVSYVLYVAVLPVYRNECLRLLHARFKDALVSFASAAHLDPSVRSGVDAHLMTPVVMHRLGGRAFLQTGHWGSAVLAKTTVLDLNPRSMTAWLILIARRLLGRRTLMWGHLHPQAGRSSPTAWLRRTMARISSGLVTYTYSQRSEAVGYGRPVWVAPNSLYREQDIHPGDEPATSRDSALYVGRFEPAKKVGLLVEGFARAVAEHDLDGVLRLVGGGAEEGKLRDLVRHLGIAERVRFEGSVTDVDRLRQLYQRAYCSVSPGFVGLGLTQSLGFGVPQIVARDEPHSPEIELAALGGVRWFCSNDADDLAHTLVDACSDSASLPLGEVSARIRETYSAEAMANGLAAALTGQPPPLTLRSRGA